VLPLSSSPSRQDFTIMRWGHLPIHPHKRQIRESYQGFRSKFWLDVSLILHRITRYRCNPRWNL